MSSLGNIIEDLYYYPYGISSYRIPSRTIQSFGFFEVPILKEGTFEIPLFAIDDFKNKTPCSKEDMPDGIVASFFYCGRKSTYKSLEAIIKDLLRYRVNEGLHKVDIIPNNTYYIAQGAIFNERMTPLMLCSWKVNLKLNEENKYIYKIQDAIMRIHPACFTIKETAMDRFIINKFLNTALQCRVPSMLGTRSGNRMDIKVLVEKNPFRFKRIEAPSITSSNDSLIKLAIDNIDEIAS